MFSKWPSEKDSFSEHFAESSGHFVSAMFWNSENSGITPNRNQKFWRVDLGGSYLRFPENVFGVIAGLFQSIPN